MTDTATAAQSLLRRVQRNPATATDAVDLDELRAFLESDDPAVRRHAVTTLRLVAAHNATRLCEEWDGYLDVVRSLCADPDVSVRTGAIAVLTLVSESDPDAREPALDTIAPLLTDESQLVRRQALEGLRQLGSSEPDALVAHVDDVAPFLDAPEGDVRKHAVGILALAASVDGASVTEVVPELFELFRDDEDVESITPRAVRNGTADTIRQEFRRQFESMDSDRLARHRFVRQMSGHAICQAAAADPDAVAPMVDDLAALLTDPDPQVRSVAVDTFVALADGKPEAVAPHGDALADRLAGGGVDGELEIVRARSAQALAALGVTEPDVVADVALEGAADLRELLDHDEPAVRGSAASVLALVATVHPDADVVEPAAERLRALREDDVEYVRAAAADALDAVR